MKDTPANRAKVNAFIEYASDTEGMVFNAAVANGQIVVSPQGDYDPQCVAAVKRQFNEEWRAFNA